MIYSGGKKNRLVYYFELKANPDYKRLKQVPNLIIYLDTEVSTPPQLSNTPQNPITDLIGY